MGKKLDPKLFEALEQVIVRYKDHKGPLMPVMQAAQDLFGYLPIEVQDYIARGLDIPLVKVYGVATFYSQFKLEPNGENTISVCLGTACYVRGAQKVLDRLKEELGIEEGKTTPDGLFTLSGTRCLGCCGLAPVIMINDDVYGRLKPDDIPGILDKYRRARSA
ncbi:MAG: NADH-quinone oxidoreductase subunit NuoE [Clostridiales bacterium]|nr:NADH-quinone oxidoreductase subunit NuoE [Clostridiales bacterium]